MYRKNSIAKGVLWSLEKAVDGCVRFEDFAYNPMLYINERPLKKSSLARALKRLREKGFIEEVNEDLDVGKIILRLTEIGKEFVLLSKNEDEINWDGRWRMVIFDIPENKRLLRDVLRGRLKLWGFKPWQKSVWVSKKNLTNKMRQLIKELDIEKWVLVMETDNIGR